ncbi:hypothetical protein SRB5_01630 [Streptomyces sp. RB5]|uniref:MFS transporter n=1 Tax=Streptomyces smaragdinus TaxID=2585196 RepID=A0A7K0C9D9_9ACTN|nr:MFS transporter [Streptomyces smaragdinus]MQY10059.1 hypothetical protein [Streptomyces smaragdinus]
MGRSGRYITARTLSSVGSLTIPVAMAYLLVHDLGRGAGAVSVVLTAQILGNALFVLPGGLLADRTSALRTMVGADVVRVVVQCSLAGYLFAGGSRVAVIAGCVFVNGAMASQFNPAAGKFLKTGIPAGQVKAVSAGVASGASGALVCGPVAGALLVGLAGPTGAVVADAVSFAVSAALLSSLRAGAAPAVRGWASRVGLVREARRGLAEVVGRRWLVAGMACVTVIGMVGGGVLQVALPVLAPRFGDARWAFSGWQVALGCGGVAGGLLASRLRPRFPLRVMCPFVVVASVPFVALVAGAPFAVTCAAFVVLGVTQTVLNVLWQTVVTHHVPADVIGRVASLGSFSALVGMPLGLVLSGLVIERSGPALLLWLGVAGTLGASLFLFAPSARALPAEPVDGDVPVAPGLAAVDAPPRAG